MAHHQVPGGCRLATARNSYFFKKKVKIFGLLPFTRTMAVPISSLPFRATALPYPRLQWQRHLKPIVENNLQNILVSTEMRVQFVQHIFKALEHSFCANISAK